MKPHPQFRDWRRAATAASAVLAIGAPALAQSPAGQAPAPTAQAPKCGLGGTPRADAAGIDRSLAACRGAALAGDAEAAEQIGDLYRQGGGSVKADYAEARRWYEMAARRDDPAAARKLGVMCARGEGGKADKKRAMELWKSADAAGDPMVAILIADEIFSGITGGRTPGPGQFAFRGGIPVADIEVAEDWYSQARDRDPRPDVKQRAERALTVLAQFRQAAQSVSIKK